MVYRRFGSLHDHHFGLLVEKVIMLHVEVDGYFVVHPGRDDKPLYDT